jgi:hypothetical protein
MQSPTIISTSLHAFAQFLEHAPAGARHCYHRGELWIDRDEETSRLQQDDRRTIDALARFAYQAHERGLVRLVQRRREADPPSYEYVAVRTPCALSC